MEDYQEYSVKKLSNIWHKISEGDPILAEKELTRRIQGSGQIRQEGPAKVISLKDGEMTWQFLTPWQVCNFPCIAYDVGYYD